MAGLFDSWRALKDDATIERDWQQFCRFSPQSLPLILPSATQHTEPTVLPLFGAASASPDGSGLAAATQAQDGLTEAEASDVVFNAGAPVWAMDWCPIAAAGADAARADDSGDFLAVGCHPLDGHQHVIGAAVQGRNCLQIWHVRHPQGSPNQRQQGRQERGSCSLPRLALAVAHDGGLAWDCRWCRGPALADVPPAAAGEEDESETLPRLGLLAAALGDGSLRVWAVPRPEAASQLQPPADAAAGAPLVLSLPPVARADSGALGGSLPCVVDWLPAEPFDLLAVGCWDGTVAVFQLAPPGPRSQQQQQQQQQAAAQQQQPPGGSPGASCHGLRLLSHFAADALPLRVVRWVPPGPCSGSIDQLCRHVIFTGGHEGCLRIWDLRDPFQPLYSHTLSSAATILGGAWTERPFGITVCLEDASIRGTVLDSGVIDRGAELDGKAMFSVTARGANMGGLWSLAVHPTMQAVAYGGEDGEVGLFRADYEPQSRRRLPHKAVAGLRLKDGALVVRGAQELEAGHGLFCGKVVERQGSVKGARLPEEAEAVHRVAWSGHGGAQGAWLASGGVAGLVRCQLIRSV